MKLGKEYVGFTVSQATLRTEDLVESILEFLDSIDHPLTDHLWERASKTLEGDYFLNEVLWDIMNEIAPEGTTFRAHEGDGALFGFWPYKEVE